MNPIHPDYLPFTVDQLREHFAPVAGSPGDRDRHLRYYLESAKRASDYARRKPVGTPAAFASKTRLALQLQKDERFWLVTVLLSAYYSSDRRTTLKSLLTMSLGESPPIDGAQSWDELISEEARIYFEVNLPSPTSYRDWLAPRRQEQILVPFVLANAMARTVLEGPTKADAMLIDPETKFAVVFEAKVLSDVSTQTSYDCTRNQIARNMDVLLDPHPKLLGGLNARDPQRSCFVLVTPRLFRDNPETRLYGHLMNAYRNDSEMIAKHLPHRKPEELDGVHRRLGWITWEDCDDVIPGARPWIQRQRDVLDS